MKVEPKTLKQVLVYAGRKRVPKKTYEIILRDVAVGRKEKACIEATRLVAREANIDKSVVTDVLASLNKIRHRRGAGTFRLPNTL